MIALLFATSAAMTTPAAAHTTTVSHAGTPVQVSYAPRVATRMKTVGAATGARMSQQRCAWTAEVAVDRAVAGGHAALDRTLPGGVVLEGSRHGDCLVNRVAILDEVERRTGAVRAQVEQVAADDRGTLLAELEQTRGVALD